MPLNWKEYGMNESSVADWLSWGGLTHPNIMRGKDDSFFSILAYKPYQKQAEDEIPLPNLKNGWCFWIEHQHRLEADAHYLVLGWNPFFNRSHKIINSTKQKGELIAWEEAQDSFFQAVCALEKGISQLTECRILAYQEILDALSFSLSITDHTVTMPDVPLYLDALLTQDLDIDFSGRLLKLEGKQICAISLPAMAEDQQIAAICAHFAGSPYRYVRRLMIFSEKRAKKEETWYTGRWCGGRKSIRKEINDGILKKLNGYHTESFFLPFEPDRYEEDCARVRTFLDTLKIPYIIEDYNQKDVWWGSIPGMFRSNITPPIIGFDSLGELLAHRQP
ncbi:hypothetical protein [uncultured Mitsuokella sp.]|uniref:hypothetical protein n=1 Tax=uncultured Mitsuokella sp. TaxID=453120 RepID=UPI002629CFDA|nr:hypothetical protein [uncultured Mitsuokella sp.]